MPPTTEFLRYFEPGKRVWWWQTCVGVDQNVVAGVKLAVL